MSSLKFDVESFLDSLNIFQQRQDNGGVRAACATALGFLALVTPAAVLRADGRIGISAVSFQPLKPAEQAALSPNALLNIFLRFGGAAGSLYLSLYAWRLIQAEFDGLPLNLKKQEALDILETEDINRQVVEIIGEEEQPPSPQQQAIPPVLQQLIANARQNADKSKEGSDTESQQANQLAEALAFVKEHKGQGDKWRKFREIGESILGSMGISDKSALNAAGTGAGKTTTENEYLKRLCAKSPNIELKALLNKNDKLYGVKPENITIFRPELFDHLGTERDALEIILKPLFEVYQIFLHRKGLPIAERDRLRREKPVRCILGDWYATFQELKARLSGRDAPKLQIILSIIRQILTVGRDSGVGLIVDSQSANLGDLGIADSAPIRGSLDVYSQGYIYYEGGESKGELQTIRLIFQNDSICGKEHRKLIAEAYQLLAQAVENGEIDTPIIFTSVGAFPRIGILPRLAPLDQYSADTTPVTPGVSEQYRQEEFTTDLWKQDAINAPQMEGDKPKKDEFSLSPKAIKLLHAVKNLCNREHVEWVKIWKAARNCNLSKEEWEAAASELEQAELVLIDSEDNIAVVGTMPDD